MHPSTLSEEPTGEPPDLGAPIPSFPPPVPLEDEPTLEPEPELIEIEIEDTSEVDAPEVPSTPFDQDPLSSVDDATPSSSSGTSAVFLKQNGQIYMVSDWETLKRWIAESRVERHDLVSEGGVRWEPVGNRPELMSAFGGAAPVNSPFPFGGETPFGSDSGGGNLGWHDDDTEGVPTGLPPLPTDEVPPSDARGFDALDARLRKMTPTPPPVARRAPPPARPAFLTPTPAPVAAIDPDDIATAQPEPREYAPPDRPQPEVSIAPPALPDTIPPAPERKPPAPAMIAEDDPDITQPRVVLDAKMHPKAYQMADEDTIKTVPVRDDAGISDVHDLPPLTEPLYADSFDDGDIEIRRTSPAFYVGSAVLVVLLFVACFGVTYVLTPPKRTPPEPIPSLPLPADTKPSPTPVEPAQPGPAEPEPPTPQPAEPEPSEPEPTEPQPAEPQPAPTATPAPEPVRPVPTSAPPRPAPEPAPTRPSPPPRPAPAPAPRPTANVNKLIDAGWGLVDSNPASAATKFRQAVDAAPQNADANFGYGYALIKQGKKDQARKYLCTAVRKGSLDTRREAEGTLAAAGLSCGG